MSQVGGSGRAVEGGTARTRTRDRGVQRQARALGDPTRFAIFQHVVGAATPVRVATLTDEFGLNHNAIRQHLAKLCEAGLVLEEVAARSGPGRPALQYRVAPGIAGTWSTRGPYEQLALLLLSVAAGDRSAREAGSAAGREAASNVDVRRREPVTMLVEEMQRRGFEPRRVARRTAVDVVLDHCPFATAAAANPAIVCEIHRGLAEGFLEAVGGDVHVSELVVRNPTRGGCRLQLQPVGPVDDA